MTDNIDQLKALSAEIKNQFARRLFNEAILKYAETGDTGNLVRFMGMVHQAPSGGMVFKPGEKRRMTREDIGLVERISYDWELQDRIQFAERPREFYLGLDYLKVDGQQIPFTYTDAYVIVVPSTNQVTVFRGALMEMGYIPRVVMVDVPREESAGAAMAYMMASLKYPDAENQLDAMLEDMADGGDA